MKDSPPNLFVKDPWFFTKGDETHCIHMQQYDPDQPEDRRQFRSLGHAVSSDLITWRRLPTALRSNDGPGSDDKRMHTGDVIEKEGVFYLFYTGTGARDLLDGPLKESGRGLQTINLATSTDAIHWEKHPDNPLLAPDPRYYNTQEKLPESRCHAWPIADFRDFHVVADPEGNGYWGFVAARVPGKIGAETSAIALAHSGDLIHWEQYPPCFIARSLYNVVEVPDVFFLDGKWYMLLLTGCGYGQRHATLHDRDLRHATIYAVADQVQGPYTEPENNIIHGSMKWGAICRSLVKDGSTYLMKARQGTIDTPNPLGTDSSGRLFATYPEELDAYTGPTLLDSIRSASLSNDGTWGSIGDWRETSDGMEGHCANDWAVRVFAADADDFVYEATIQLEDAAAAGLLFRAPGENIHAGGLAVILDAGSQSFIVLKLRSFEILDKRQVPVERNRDYTLKCVARSSFLDFYLDGQLLLQPFCEDFLSGRFGLYVERGTATFSNLSAKALNLTPATEDAPQVRGDHTHPGKVG